jgi:hypothetical protein
MSWRELASQDMTPPRSAGDLQWASPPVTLTQKKRIRTMLRNKAESLGGLTQQTAEELAQWRQLQRLVQDSPVAPADLAWAWVAERQQEGEEQAQDIYRPSAGVGGTSNRYWQEVAQTRSGWRICGRGDFTPDQLQAMAETATLEDILVTMELSAREDEAPLLGGQQRRDLWQTVKSRGFFRGTGGMFRFNIVLGLLMVNGQIQGPVVDPSEGGWWDEVMKIADIMRWTTNPTLHTTQTSRHMEREDMQQMFEEDTGEEWGASPDDMWEGTTVGRETPDSGVALVVVDLMAGSQSLRAPAEELGMIYIPMDKQRFVYSPQMATVVENIEFDILEDSPMQILAKVTAAVEATIGNREWQLVYAWASPDCTTFSKMNNINKPKGNGYRDNDSNPLQTPKGEKAARHDEMVENLIALLKHWDNELDCLHFAIENPTEGLTKRPYMNRGFMQRTTDRHEVNYCVYQHKYMKPTHIWCTIPGWDPKGRSGNGLCRAGGRCNMGSIGEKGYYNHEKRLGQASQEEVSRPGRKAYKSSVPRGLHREILQALQADHEYYGLKR